MSILGTRIRKLRKERELTLAQLASRSGVSRSFISQIERGQSSPSISTLRKVAHTLGLPVEALVSEQLDPLQSKRIVYRHANNANEIQIRIGNCAVSYTYLSGDFPDRTVELLFGRFPPNYKCKVVEHDGEEFGYVIEGTLVVEISGNEYTLNSGDSYHFSSRTPHRYSTLADEGAIVYWGQTEQVLEIHNTTLLYRHKKEGSDKVENQPSV